MHMNLDPVLVDKIANEVKSQGVFDQFRKDSMADVDTKPAYQNLRQRVETTVTKFLSDQIWTKELNKNQLRDKLRKHITEAGFLDTGVERIVDQVVNPKISTVFQPKIEDIAYAFLGIEKPQIKIDEKPVSFTNGDLGIKTDFLPTDLEAVSPDSDKTTDEKPEFKEDLLNDSDDKNEEFESPPFEPLEGLGCPPSPEKKEESNESQISGISGLTSQDSIPDTKENITIIPQADLTQESELSEVSSNSRLSIVTNGGEDSKSQIKVEADVGISEEAQMPKFSDSASSNLESGENLHFDIKKEEIKFEGTDWKSEKRVYFSCISENLPPENIEIKTEFQPINPEMEQSGKIEDISASPNLTYSTDTQISAASKFTDSEKFDKKIKSSPENFYEGNNDSSSRLPDRNRDIEQEKKYSITPTPSTPKERSRSHKKSHKRSSEKDKYNSSESSRHDSHSPRTSSSRKKHKSSSEDRKHKSHSHKSKHSREKHNKSSRNKSKDRKHMVEKDSKGKIHDYCSDRNRKYRRKSTDSNDEADASKDIYKNTSTSSLDRIERTKESNSSNSSNYSANTNGSVDEGSANAANERSLRTYGQADENSESVGNFPKPIILDDLLGNDARSNIELIIGAKILVDTKHNVEQKKQIGKDGGEHKHSEENNLKFFEHDPVEIEDCNNLMAKLSNAINKTSSVYIIDCDEDYRTVFEKLGLNVIQVKADDFSGTYICKETQAKIINDGKIIEKVNGSFTEHKKKESKLLESMTIITAPNGKRKRNVDNYYQPATYCVFTDEKIRNNTRSLIIDCFEYTGSENSTKKIKTSNFTIEPFVSKISPTPSELSVGSKENEFADKKISEQCADKLEDIVPRKRSISLRASQRYSSEDLYKPRPVLGQRSKRRAIETEVM